MSSEHFESLEFDFNANIQTVTKKVNQQIPNYSGEQRKACVRAAQKELERASELLKDMDQEARVAPPQYRTKLASKVSSYERDLQRLKSDLSTVASGSYTALGRQELMGARPGDADYGSNQRQRVLDANQTLMTSSDRLQNTRRIAEESEQIGTNTLLELGEQRETIVRSGQYLGTVDQDLSKSRSVLNTMSRRIITNKLILILIICVLMGILGMTIYLKLK